MSQVPQADTVRPTYAHLHGYYFINLLSCLEWLRFLFHLQGCALRKIEGSPVGGAARSPALGCPAYDLYEKSKIF